MTLPKAWRKKHPRFIYLKYSWKIEDDQLLASWHFQLKANANFQPKSNVDFKPTLSIDLPQELTDGSQPINELTERKYKTIDQLVFHIGLVEMLSYWKVAASPEIIIEAGYLNHEQLAWWHNLLINGMGEYFYQNQIDFTKENFVTISCIAEQNQSKTENSESKLAKNKTFPPQNLHQYRNLLIPLGGGKDSVLSLELLLQAKRSERSKIKQIVTAGINPTPATKQIAQTANVDLITINRQLDPKLLELNQQGCLNGHTPFSALAAFITTLTAYLYDLDAIVISNEHSSNEGNVHYLGHNINHQYSKSYDFELKFRQYITQFLQQSDTKQTPQISGTTKLLPETAPLLSETAKLLPEYFSLLRPLYELQIAQAFAKYGAAHFLSFRSCNVGQKTNTWCCNCSKCLFAFAIIFPFLGEKQMVEIFGENLFEKASLFSVALELIGKTTTKPFECVGTHDESLAAFFLSAEWYRHHGKPLPLILKKLDEQFFTTDEQQKQTKPLSVLADSILSAWNDQHQVPPQLEKIVRERLMERPANKTGEETK